MSLEQRPGRPLVAQRTISRSCNNLFGYREMSGRFDFADEIAAFDPMQKVGLEKPKRRVGSIASIHHR